MSRKAPKTLPKMLREMYKDLDEDAQCLNWTAIDGRFHRLLQAADEIERLRSLLKESTD
jgi:hypothetical protein